jgi:anti-anti-sigma factor
VSPIDGDGDDPGRVNPPAAAGDPRPPAFTVEGGSLAPLWRGAAGSGCGLASYFDVRIESPVGQVVRVPVVGVVDLESSDVFFQVLSSAVLVNWILRVEVDLTGVTLLDASGIGVLLAVRNQAHARGMALRAYGASGLPLRVLEITGVLGLLDGKGDAPRQRPPRTLDDQGQCEQWIRA